MLHMHISICTAIDILVCVRRIRFDVVMGPQRAQTGTSDFWGGLSGCTRLSTGFMALHGLKRGSCGFAEPDKCRCKFQKGGPSFGFSSPKYSGIPVQNLF